MYPSFVCQAFCAFRDCYVLNETLGRSAVQVTVKRRLPGRGNDVLSARAVCIQDECRMDRARTDHDTQERAVRVCKV